MGCAPSKQSVCRNCHAQCSPIRRSYASLTDYSPQHDGDGGGGGNHHVVALTSTTLGNLLLDPSTKPNQVLEDPALVQVRPEPVRQNAPEKNNSKDFALGVTDDEKMTKIAPKTPIRKPPGEPETINSWELMEGLDDLSPLHSIPPDEPTLPSQKEDPNAEESCKPLCLQFTDNHADSNSNSIGATKSLQIKKDEIISCNKEKLILYFTSLRGVRKTYEDCCHVRVILKNSGVRVDERDVSMHSGFKEELKELLGDRYGCGGLPKVFIGNKYIGGADEIRRFHDEFHLDKVLEGCYMVDDGGGGGGVGGGCEACGDVRFLPCETCSGSCKIYYEINSDEGEKEAEESDYGFQRCPDCNENGLIRCPICCD